MRKKICLLTIVMTLMLICTACTYGKLEYDYNLGYDLNNVKYSDITFNVYHSNTEGNKWEKIASFPCTPQPGHYNDVKLECKENQISIDLWDKTYTEAEDGSTATYDGTIEASYKFNVDGFKGNLPGWKYFAIKDVEGEQLVRLYPISNSGAVCFLEDIGLDKAYDIDEDDVIDNILITIEMK